tara:strand:+ start:383 stop:769 length:387 start_codon:yes stop_codon:yes gene_type:complete
MEPNIWGPQAWTFLHSITLNYPETPTIQDKQNHKVFFESLQHVIPCPNCKKHYKQNLIKFPIQLDSKNDFIQWLVNIHNEVNKKNKKRIWSVKEVKKKYKKMYDKTDYTNYYLLILFIICILFYFYYN